MCVRVFVVRPVLVIVRERIVHAAEATDRPTRARYARGVVGRRQRREKRVQIGEALALGGLVALVVTPLVYRAHAASNHVVAEGSLLWPTAWMLVPLALVVVGVLVILSASNLVGPRGKMVRESHRAARGRLTGSELFRRR